VRLDRPGFPEAGVSRFSMKRRLDGFDDHIASLYARGMTIREIQGHLQEPYGVEVSPDLISRITDATVEEVCEWQNQPLGAVYPMEVLGLWIE
jgi:putative transposase